MRMGYGPRLPLSSVDSRRLSYLGGFKKNRIAHLSKGQVFLKYPR